MCEFYALFTSGKENFHAHSHIHRDAGGGRPHGQRHPARQSSAFLHAAQKPQMARKRHFIERTECPRQRHRPRGDVVSVALSERTPREDLYCANAAKPDIVYEDDDLLVLNKPAGVAMHPKSGDASAPSLAAMLTSYLGEGSVPHFVSRLDKGTSGLLIAAKSGYVHDRLRRALHSSDLRREYRAVAVGRVEPPYGVIDAPIGPRGGLHHPPLRARGRTSEPHRVRDPASKRPLHAPAPAPTDGSYASASRPHGIPRSSPRGRLALRHGGQNPHRPPRAALVRAVVHPAGHRTGITLYSAYPAGYAALDGMKKHRLHDGAFFRRVVKYHRSITNFYFSL